MILIVQLVNRPGIGSHCIQVHNIYNQPHVYPSPVIMELDTVLNASGMLEDIMPNTTTEHIIIGDFNTHHPTWGGDNIRPDSRADELLHIMYRYQLEQHLPKGTSTYISP